MLCKRAIIRLRVHGQCAILSISHFSTGRPSSFQLAALEVQKALCPHTGYGRLKITPLYNLCEPVTHIAPMNRPLHSDAILTGIVCDKPLFSFCPKCSDFGLVHTAFFHADSYVESTWKPYGIHIPFFSMGFCAVN